MTRGIGSVVRDRQSKPATVVGATPRNILADERRAWKRDMSLATIAQAIGAFVVTNIDDIVVLAVFYGQVPGHRGAAMRVIVGQYLGFGAILAVSISGALLGATLLPPAVLPYFGLLPITLGLRSAWVSWRHGRDTETPDAQAPSPPSAPGIWQVAAVTFANGGDNIGVYVPIFAATTIGSVAAYVVVFLIGVAVWCAAGRYLASRPIIAEALSRWGHIILPVALIAIGTTILVEGGAFGLSP